MHTDPVCAHELEQYSTPPPPPNEIPLRVTSQDFARISLQPGGIHLITLYKETTQHHADARPPTLQSYDRKFNVVTAHHLTFKYIW